ncbi:unnamed protein product, partial [Ectocarpus sp. 12 AP-2014]
LGFTCLSPPPLHRHSLPRKNTHNFSCGKKAFCVLLVYHCCCFRSESEGCRKVCFEERGRTLCYLETKQKTKNASKGFFNPRAKFSLFLPPSSPHSAPPGALTETSHKQPSNL